MLGLLPARRDRSRLLLQTDPVPGGSANAYDYCGQDPSNSIDLDGKTRVQLPQGGHSSGHPGRHHRRSGVLGKAGTSKSGRSGLEVHGVVVDCGPGWVDLRVIVTGASGFLRGGYGVMTIMAPGVFETGINVSSYGGARSAVVRVQMPVNSTRPVEVEIQSATGKTCWRTIEVELREVPE